MLMLLIVAGLLEEIPDPDSLASETLSSLP